MQPVEIPLSIPAQQLLEALAAYPPEVAAEVYTVLQKRYGHNDPSRFSGRGTPRLPNHLVNAATRSTQPQIRLCPNCGQQLLFT